MRHIIQVAAIGLLLIPAALGAQQGGAAARIEAAYETAASTGLPVSLLESKVQEGRAKGVPEARIAAAVEARLAALSRAQSALTSAGARGIVAADLAVAADALQAGVEEASVVDVMTRVPPARRAVATAVLTELVELGLASDVALSRVHTAVRQGGEALVNLPGQVSERSRGNARGRVRVDVDPTLEVDAGLRGRGGRPND